MGVKTGSQVSSLFSRIFKDGIGSTAQRPFFCFDELHVTTMAMNLKFKTINAAFGCDS